MANAADARRLAESGESCLNPEVAGFKSIRSLAEEFPWGPEEGPVWQGTGHPDPEPLKAVSDAEMLRRAALSGSSGEREHALISIGRRQLPGALAAIERAQNHAEPEAVRETAVAALVEHGRAEALPLLWRGMSDPSQFVRGLSVWALALYGHKVALKAIHAALDDPSPYVVGMGILATTALRDEADFWPIIDRVVGSQEIMIYQEAAYVLAQIDSEFARDYLRREYDASKGERRTIFRWSLKENLRNRLY